MTPEAKVKKEIREYIDGLPKTCRIAVPANGYGKSGWPDDVVCHKGLFFAIEIKPKGKDTTPYQRDRAWELVGAGAVYGVCWSVEDVKRLFEDGEGKVPAMEHKQYKTYQYHH